jgi:hypothetical protein
MDMEVGFGTLLPMAVPGQPVVTAQNGCCGVVLGATIRGAAARPPASGARAASRATASVFGSSALPRGLFNCPLLFFPLVVQKSPERVAVKGVSNETG